MEHLSLEIFDLTPDSSGQYGSKYAVIPDDTSITITDTSEIFASGDVWSHSFTLNVFANAHIFGTAGDLHGSRLHEQINKRKARLWVEGLPLYLGFLTINDEVEVDNDGNVDVTFDSGRKTFDDMIEGGKANQVPFTEDILIGMALWQDRECEIRLNVQAVATLKEGSTMDLSGRYSGGEQVAFSWEEITVSSKDIGVATRYPRMVFPKGVFANRVGDTPEGGISVNQINTDFPYDDAHPYCNIALCYQKYGYPTVNGKVDYSSDQQKLRGYETMPANRVNSAPNFFVLYWIKCLMKHIGIDIEENQMMDVEDFKRLFFVNTNCAYEVPTVFDRTGEVIDERYGCFTTYGSNDYVSESFEKTVDIINSKLNVDNYKWLYNKSGNPISEDQWYYARKMELNIKGLINLTSDDKKNYFANNRCFHYAYATKECFPDVDISEVIEALENGFGVRFLFNDNYQRVRIVLLRNVLQCTYVQEIPCDILGEDVKTENCIRGFRMTYGDNKEDTSFYYKGFDDKLEKANDLWYEDNDTHDYSHWNLDADYKKLITNISAFDKTCYVTPNNGNAYGIKIEKDAKAYEDLHPSLFEYAGYMNAEDGDCTGDDETIETITVGFTPAIMNDVNFENERENNTTEQQFALFVDEEMRSRRADLGDKVEPASYNDSDAVYDISKIPTEKKELGMFKINSDMPVRTSSTGDTVEWLVHEGQTWNLHFKYELDASGYINEGIRMYLQDNFEPNDDGVCPIESHNWGLTLGIMRGSGSDAYVEYGSDPDDAENYTWDIVSGSSITSHQDTCDNYGNEWDYNGTIHVETKENAEVEIRSRYPDTADNILEPRRIVTVQQIEDAGWEVKGDRTRIAEYYYYRFTFISKSKGRITVYTTPIVSASTCSYDGPDVLTKEVINKYLLALWDKYMLNMVEHDPLKIIYAINTDSWSTLAYLRAVYHGYLTSMDLDNGLGITDGRFSLKLRAEKPNPYYVKGSTDEKTKDKYLPITNPNLRGRGLCDQFYKEYSYWVRNARIVKRTVRMELSQLLAIDKTKRVKVGDVTGFIKKMQYSINSTTGLGLVTIEIMYI